MGTYLPIEPEKMSDPILDPNSPSGFRVIVVLKYCKVTKVIVSDAPAYEEVREEDLKERFRNHSPIVFVDADGKEIDITSKPPVDVGVHEDVE